MGRGALEDVVVELAETLAEPVFVWRLPGEFLWANASFERTFGMGAADFAFRNEDNPFIHPDDLPHVLGAIDAFVKSDSLRSPPIENRFADRWGRVHALRSFSIKVTWEGAPALLCICRAMGAERAADAVDASYRVLVEAAREGIVKVALDGRVLYANPRFREIVALGAVELGKARLLDLVHDDDRSGADRALACVRAGDGELAWDGRLKRPDGAVRWVHASGGRLDGMPEGDVVFVVVRDVTEARALEEKVRQSQKAESLGVLAGGIVHDFNNILTCVLANASLLASAGHLDGDARDRLADVVTSAERGAALTRSLLAYLGQSSRRPEVIDLAPLVRDTVRMVTQLLPRLVTLRIDEPPSPLRVTADAGQLGQVFLNLLTNAAESLGDRAGEVVVEMREVEAHARVRVRDDGCGMSPAVLERVFDPFFSTKSTGRGLGLSAVLGIVRSHGGTIAVDSRPGVGTTFDVLLPLATSDVTAPQGAPPPTAEPAAGRGPILVVEDESRLRRVARLILEEAGFDVELAEDGERGVAAFGAAPARFAAVVLDQSMPVMRGDVAAARIRALRADVPIVHVTGFREAGQPVPGAVPLDKPYSADDLVAAVQAAIAGRG